MKGKLKKLIAGAAVLAMAAQFAFVLPASAEAELSLSNGFDNDASSATGGEYTWAQDIPVANSNNDLNGSAIDFNTHKNAAVIGSGMSGNGGTKGDFQYDIVSFTEPIGAVGKVLDISMDTAKRYNGEVNTMTVSFDDASGNTLFGIRYNITGRNGTGIVELVSNDKTALLENNYAANTWRTHKIQVGYISNGVGYVKVGDTALPYNAAAVSKISFKKTGDTQNRGAVLDNLKLEVNTPAKQSYLVTYVYGENSENTVYEVVEAGGTPAHAPDPKVIGTIFKGWKADESTTHETLDGVTVSENITLTVTV